MATPRQWAAFFTGEYSGWFRSPPGDWEDMIGRIEMTCVPGKDGRLDVSITCLEVPSWTGTLLLDGLVLTLNGKDGRPTHRLTFEQGLEGGAGRFYGKSVRGPADELSLRMAKAARSPR